jgi:hypothetical protein
MKEKTNHNLNGDSSKQHIHDYMKLPRELHMVAASSLHKFNFLLEILELRD